VVGFAAAVALTEQERATAVTHTTTVRDELLALLEAIPGVVATAPSALRVPGHAHITIDGVASDELLFVLDRAGVCASAAASCSSGAGVPSHVLDAMGFAPHRAKGALRLTIGAETTSEDVRAVAAIVSDAVQRLRTA
jgi:cysteine desulfurase